MITYRKCYLVPRTRAWSHDSDNRVHAQPAAEQQMGMWFTSMPGVPSVQSWPIGRADDTHSHEVSVRSIVTHLVPSAAAVLTLHIGGPWQAGELLSRP